MLQPLFSPMLLAGLAMRFVPLSLVEKAVAKAVHYLNKDQIVANRLKDIDNPTWLIDPIDLPYCFYLFIDEDKLDVTTFYKEDDLPQVNATIHASLLNLLKMVDGKSDGDALFFSRSLMVDGSMDSVVALRNSLDATGIELEDIIKSFGLLGSFAFKTQQLVEPLYSKLASDMTLISNSMTSDIQAQVEQQELMISKLQQEVKELKTSLLKSGVRQTGRQRSIDLLKGINHG